MKRNVRFFIIVGLFILFDLVGISRYVRGFFERILSPFSLVSSQIVYSVQQPFYLIAKSYNSGVKIRDLELRYSEVLAELGQMQALEEENQALRALIENADRKLVDSVVSVPVVSYGLPYIGSGTQDEVRSGSLVLSSQTLVGRVDQVSERQSSVVLLASAKLEPILVKTQSGVTGIVKGDGRHILLTEVASDAEIQVGDRVVTAGQSGIQPDIFIGKISYIVDDPAQSVKTAYVDQLVSFFESRIVEVIK